MIQASELRIGNWTLFDLEEVYEQITPRRLGFILQSNSKNQSHPFKPIPLTEEILLECGFEILPTDKYRTYKTFKVGKRYLYFDESDGVWYLSYDENIAYCNNIGIVDYLHDLQNLYYFTSRDSEYEEREELEIKLK